MNSSRQTAICRRIILVTTGGKASVRNQTSANRAQLIPIELGGGKRTEAFAPDACLDTTRRAEAVPLKYQVYVKYQGAGCDKKQQASIKVERPSPLRRHSYTIAPGKKGILFHECGICRHFACHILCLSELSARWSFHQHEKGEKAPSGVRSPGIWFRESGSDW